MVWRTGIRRATGDELSAYGTALVWPASHPHILSRRRAQAIVARVQAFATVGAIVTMLWIAVDATVFPSHIWLRLAAARLAGGALFALLAASCHLAAPTLREAQWRLAFLYAVPCAFFVATQEILHAVPPSQFSEGMAAAYSFVPFVLAVGIGAFPLAVAEAATLTALAFGLEVWAVTGANVPAAPFARLDALWLVLIIAAAATFAALSQLNLMAALIQQAIRDPLTACHRRESGQELLDVQFLIAVRQHAPLTVLFADLDRFKAVNDSFGHEAGDEVLATAAAALRAMVRESDLVLRWGGEEFVVVLPHTTKPEAARLIERLRERGIGRLPDGHAITVSIGVAEVRADAVASAEALIELADRRMYLAKQAGRNCYVQTTEGIAHTILDTHSAEAGA